VGKTGQERTVEKGKGETKTLGMTAVPEYKKKPRYRSSEQTEQYEGEDDGGDTV